MQTLTERRYIFKRRSIASRFAGLALVGAASTMTLISAQTADATVGGYQRLSQAESTESRSGS
ncbi:MAG: hypothetical protein AAF788_03045 [Pseudomonadota bacterium]